MPPIMEPGEFFMPYPLEVEVGGATVFVAPGRSVRADLSRAMALDSRPRSAAAATWTRTFTADDVEAFAGDHRRPQPAPFRRRLRRRARGPGRLIVHGGLTTGLFNALVAEVLPGPGCVFLHQEWDYPAPA